MSDLRMELIQGQLNDIEENVRSIKATWGNTIMTLDNIKSGLKADRQKAIDEAYQRGIDDAWEVAKKIFGYEFDGGLPVDELRNAFGFESGPFCTADILRTNTASEAIAKLKAYEEQRKADAEIKVGDEVMSNNAISDHTGVVLALSLGETSAKVLENDGSMAWVAVNVLIKTGRHFNFLASLLEAMKEGAE